MLHRVPLLERMWLWILAVVALTSTSVEGIYDVHEINQIVIQNVMPMWRFARPVGWQYAVLVLLPPNKRTHVNPDRIWLIPSPGDRDARGDYVTFDDHMKRNGGNLLEGINYAIARVNNRQHAETQLLDYQFLNGMLNKLYRLVHPSGLPSILLYTRGTPCGGCTNAIIAARLQFQRRVDQFFVVYSTNMQSRPSRMTPTSNCVNRKRMRAFNIQVTCLREQYDASAGHVQNQCIEDDSVPCDQHVQHYTTPNPWIRSNVAV